MRRRRVITWSVLGVLCLGGLSAWSLALQREHDRLFPDAVAAARATGCDRVEVRGGLLWVMVENDELLCTAAAVAAAKELGLTFDDLGRTHTDTVVYGRRGKAAAERHGSTWAYAFKVS